MKQLFLILSILLLCFTSLELAAQNELKVKDPNGNILLEVRDEGVMVKKVTTAERTGFTLTTTEKGLLVYDTDLSAFFSWDGAQWVQIDGTDLVDDADADPTNELQDISLSGNQLSITNGSTVELTGLGVDTDDQTLSLTGSELSISEGNTVDLSNIDINLSGSDLASPGCPGFAGKLTFGGLQTGVAVSGNYAYVISSNASELNIVDISIPSAPTVTGTLPGLSSSFLFSIVVNGNYAYVARAGLEQDLAVIDVSNPAAPTLVGATPNLGGNPREVVIRDNYAYVALAGSFKVVDVSNPATPTVIESVNGIGGWYLAISGDYAYISDYINSQLKIVNIANPAAPTLVSTTPLGYQPEEIAIHGSYVYIVDYTNEELKIIDVSDPNAPNPVGSFSSKEQPSENVYSGGEIVVVDDLAYYLTSSFLNVQYGKIQILDLSDPANPTLLKTITDTQNGFKDGFKLAVADQRAFATSLSSNPGALFIFELCPQNIGFGLNPYTDEIVLTTPIYQDLSLSGDMLSLTNDATPVDLSGFLDNTDNQDLALSGTALTLTNDDTAVDLSGFLDNTDNQDLSLSGNTLSLTNDGTPVDLSGFLDNTDNQDLSLSGNTLSLTNDGTPVNLSAFLDSPWEVNGANVYRINGNIGIGIAPTKAKLEISGSIPFDPPGDIGYLNAAGQVGHYNPGSWPYSIYATNVISGQEFHAHSDERIKNILGVSDSRSDLNTLLQIEITDYRLRDTIAHGSRATKKVIAQQVEKVYPQAVTADITEVVPDIYQRAAVEENWVMLATDLQVGERVKLITEKANSIYTVTAVEAGRFQVELPAAGSLSSTVFVYGREVNDFHTVDYEAISMLNVSATQELAKQLESLQAENEALRAENEAFEARLSKMEAMLYSGQSASHSINTSNRK